MLVNNFVSLVGSEEVAIGEWEDECGQRGHQVALADSRKLGKQIYYQKRYYVC